MHKVDGRWEGKNIGARRTCLRAGRERRSATDPRRPEPSTTLRSSLSTGVNTPSLSNQTDGCHTVKSVHRGLLTVVPGIVERRVDFSSGLYMPKTSARAALVLMVTVGSPPARLL
jgi:hypothetical protein